MNDDELTAGELLRIEEAWRGHLCGEYIVWGVAAKDCRSEGCRKIDWSMARGALAETKGGG